MSRKNILGISIICIIFVLAIICIVFAYIEQRENVIYAEGQAIYPAATMDMLIDDAQYIALIEVADNGTKEEYQKVFTKDDGSKSSVTYVNLDTKLQILETYKGQFDADTIIYRNDNGPMKDVVLKNNEHPNFNKGQKMILFMWKNSKNNTYYLYYGIQGAFIYDATINKYINSNNVTFSDISAEIERFNNTPENDREILPKGDFTDNI